MPLFWLSLAFAVVATVASLVFATLRGLRLFREIRQLSRFMDTELEQISESSESIERHLSLAAASGERLEASLARLHAARARLNVLMSAIADVRATVGRVTAVVPRK